MSRTGTGRIGVLAIVLTLLAGACDDGSTTPDTDAVFEIEVAGETFQARVFDPATIADLEARRASGVEGVVAGDLTASDGGFNEPWSWHWDPATVAVADFAIEVCDGRPSFVEADLDYWIDTVGAYCPWGARVVRRVR